MDLNKDAILRRLDNIIELYGEAREDNEIKFSIDIGMIISQLEIYDQIWFVRHIPKKGEHRTCYRDNSQIRRYTRWLRRMFSG